MFSFGSPLLKKMRTVDDLTDLSRAYNFVFRSPPGSIVLDDLTHFCRGMQTTVEKDEDPRVLEGRRQVWLRLIKYMALTPDQIVEIASGKYPFQPKTE